MLTLFLPQLLHAVWRARVTGFWPIWIGTTGLAAICVAWAVRTGELPAGWAAREGRKTASHPGDTSHPIWPRTAVPALVVLSLFLLCYIAVTLVWEDFAYYDESGLTLFALAGHYFAPPIWRETGRFFPLGYQEFNLIRHFTSTVVGYHVFPIAQLLVLSCILLVLDDEMSITARAALTALVLTSTGVVYVFTGLLYSDRNLIVWLICMVYCIKRFDRGFSPGWAVAAAVCAQIMIYYKEPAFLLLLTFAASRLVFRSRTLRPTGGLRSLLRHKASRLDLCLCFLGGLFFLYYVAAMLPHLNKQYAEQQAMSLGQVVLFYLKLDLLAWFFAAVVLRRFYLIWRRRVEPSQLWDALAFGGLVYFAAYLYLRLAAVYYLAPVDVIAVLYLGRLTFQAWESMHLRTKAAAIALVAVVLVQDVSFSALRLVERKNVIHAKTELASAIKARYSSDTQNPQRLFFPFATPYVIMEFGSYLHYRGVPVEGAPDQPAGANNVKLVSELVANDGPCMDFRSLICHSAGQPERGDLVIVLPDDNASIARTTPYRDGGSVLFSYEPYPPIPDWLRPAIGHLGFALPNSARKEIPDRWLHASVIEWN